MKLDPKRAGQSQPSTDQQPSLAPMSSTSGIMELHGDGMHPHQMQECKADDAHQQKGVAHPKRTQQQRRGFILDPFPINMGRGLGGQRGRGGQNHQHSSRDSTRPSHAIPSMSNVDEFASTNPTIVRNTPAVINGRDVGLSNHGGGRGPWLQAARPDATP